VADQTRVNEPLLRSRADWISPGYDDEIFAAGGHPMAPDSPPSRWLADPPVTDAAKVIITDTDHYAPGQGDALWAWKSFLRGHHPILMDFGLIAGLPAAGTHEPSFEAFEPARRAMGDTRRYAERIDLIATTPDVTASSTGYALVNPGVEYLVLDPDGDAPSFTLALPPGTYEVDWFGVTSRAEAGGDPLTVGDSSAPAVLASPFPAEPSVAHLRRREVG
jgi:hypothetical protein